MDRPITGIEVEDVDREIAGRFRLLRFRASIEDLYEADETESRCKHVIRQNYIGLSIYHCFLVSDYFAVRDAFTLDLIVHFLLMTPLVFATNYVMSRRPPVWLREGILSFSLSVLALSILAVVLASRSPDRDLVNFTSVLIVLYATIVLRTRFWYVVATAVTSQVIFSVGLMTMTPFSMDRTITSSVLFLAVVVFSLIGSYNLERAQRMAYLIALRDCFRRLAFEKASLLDPLTGVGNRRALDVALRSLATSGAPLPRSSAVLLVDIDHFKDFNDTNGHQEGDACLARIADVIAKSVRQGEGAVFRYGGEEFLVLLDDLSLPVALIVAERIRAGVTFAAIPRDPAATTCVTISIGAAAGCLGGHTTPEELVGAADQALYAAKRNGRDQVWPPPPGPASLQARSSRIRRGEDRAVVG